MQHPPLSVVMPVYNEKGSVQTVLQKLLDLDFVKEVIVVDDCSTDGTTELLRQYAGKQPRITLLRHPINAGKTAALKTGFKHVTGDITIIQDADLEYDPGEIRSIIDPIVRGDADVVYGSRFLVKKATRVLYFYHYLANKFLTFCSNLLTNLNMTDVETCYKAFRSEIIKNMVIDSKKFGFEIEVTAKIAKLKCRIYEAPISYYGRTYEEGKKISVTDGLYALYYIFYYNIFISRKRSFCKRPVLRILHP
jgi:glycosyltransferase involved in cell wall biosynthesis